MLDQRKKHLKKLKKNSRIMLAPKNKLQKI